MPIGGIDFPRQQLSVMQQAVTVKRVTTIAEPKTRTSVGTIPLADATLAELSGHLEGRKATSSDLLVADKDGSPFLRTGSARRGPGPCTERACRRALGSTTSGTPTPAL